MVHPPRGGFRSLRNKIDSKVLNYVREISQTHSDSANSSRPLGVAQLYVLLQERDLHLSRIRKAQLEASIQRALDILRSEIAIGSDSGSIDSDLEGIDELNLMEVKDTNALNKLITSQWTSNQSPVGSGSQTPRGGGNSEPNGLAQKEGAENPAKRKAAKIRSQDQKRLKSILVSGWFNV